MRSSLVIIRSRASKKRQNLFVNTVLCEASGTELWKSKDNCHVQMSVTGPASEGSSRGPCFCCHPWGAWWPGCCRRRAAATHLTTCYSTKGKFLALLPLLSQATILLWYITFVCTINVCIYSWGIVLGVLKTFLSSAYWTFKAKWH